MLLASSGGGARREMIPRLSSLKFQLPRGRSGVYVLEREREKKKKKKKKKERWVRSVEGRFCLVSKLILHLGVNLSFRLFC